MLGPEMTQERLVDEPLGNGVAGGQQPGVPIDDLLAGEQVETGDSLEGVANPGVRPGVTCIRPSEG